MNLLAIFLPLCALSRQINCEAATKRSLLPLYVLPQLISGSVPELPAPCYTMAGPKGRHCSRGKYSGKNTTTFPGEFRVKIPKLRTRFFPPNFSQTCPKQPIFPGYVSGQNAKIFTPALQQSSKSYFCFSLVQACKHYFLNHFERLLVGTCNLARSRVIIVHDVLNASRI